MVNVVEIITDEVELIPAYATKWSAAVDLVANITYSHSLLPGQQFTFDSGIKLNMKDPDIAAIALPRSGLGTNHGIILANVVGLIDPDYQGPIMVTLLNRSTKTYIIKPKERIAQLIFIPVVRVRFEHVVSFSTITDRGEGGHGSTGQYKKD